MTPSLVTLRPYSRMAGRKITAGLKVPADSQVEPLGERMGDSEGRDQVPNGAACAERVHGDSAMAKISRMREEKK